MHAGLDVLPRRACRWRVIGTCYGLSSLPATLATAADIQGAQDLVTELVHADAVAQGQGLVTLQQGVDESRQAVVAALVAGGLVESTQAGSAQRLRLSALGATLTVPFFKCALESRVLKVGGPETKDSWTRFELISALRDDGWACQFKPSSSAACLQLEPASSRAGAGKVWFAKARDLVNGTVPIVYLRCLVLLDELAAKGAAEVRHCCTIKYYHDLLRLLEPGNAAVGVDLDADVGPLPGMRVDSGSGSDSISSDSSSSSGSAGAGSQASATSRTSAISARTSHSRLPHSATVNFGPFILTRVKQSNPASLVPWQAQCPFHRNTGDGPGTHCRKRLQLPDEAESILRLKLWCLEGMEIDSSGGESRSVHSFINPRYLDLTDATPQFVQARLSDLLAQMPPPPALWGRPSTG